MALTNPILDELNGLSPQAKAALAAAHGASATPPAAAAAPAGPSGPLLTAPAAPTPVLGPALAATHAATSAPAPELGMTPTMSSPGPSASLLPRAELPQATSQSQQTLMGDKAREQHIADTGSGISQIAGKVEGSGFGQRHPFLGKLLGGAAEGAALLGDVAGSAVAPQVTSLLPGTEYHHDRLLKQAQTQVAQDEANREKEAQTDLAGANSGRATAETGKLNAETAGLPEEQAEKKNLTEAQVRNLDSEATAREQPKYEVHDTANGPLFVNLKSGTAQHLSVDGMPVGPKIQTETVDLEIGGKPHKVLTNKDTGDVIKDLGPSGIKPPTVSVNAGRQEKNEVLKAYQPTQDSAERMNVMTESYEKAVKDHDQQAMLNLLANHLGMTMGLQKGARMSKDIIKEAEESQPFLQGLKAKFDSDGYLAGVTLSPNQMRQMVGLGQSRYAEDAKKSRSSAQYLGATDDGPERLPSESTIRYYTALANGDAAKAKQLAAADGWTVH